MNYQERHEMRLEKYYPSGSQEWYCPSCGRRFVMQLQSEHENLNLIVLEAGNEMVGHFGGHGGLSVNKAGVDITEDEDQILSPELKSALDEVLMNLDFGD